jgi:Antitoxin to bacterial toxin RNase LS or RnlA
VIKLVKKVDKLYQIEEVSQNVAVVFCTGYINPIAYLGRVESELSAETTKVVFDLLLCNGNSQNRFIEAAVSKSKCDRNSMKIATESGLGELLTDKIDGFYRANKSLIEDSNILMDEDKAYFLEGNSSFC